MSLVVKNAYQRPTLSKVKRLTEHSLAEGLGAAIGFIHSIVNQLVLAGTPGYSALPVQ
jgi:hypothetical protein